MEDFNEEMASYVRGWGIPEVLNHIKDDIVFKFDDNDLTDSIGVGHHCKKNDVKFCLFNINQKEILFTMDFYYKERNSFDNIGPRVNLHFIYTHSDKLRKKGIADYYISKLKEYAISKNANCINVTAVQDVKISEHDNKKNTLKIDDLEEFYRKRSTLEMPINVTALRK